MAGQSVPVVVEVLVLQAQGGELRYRSARQPLGSPPDPEAAAKAMCGSALPPDLLHSTSWREEDDAIILTFVAVTAKQVNGFAHPVGAEAAAGAASEPEPDLLTLDEVAAHACRHLAFLASTDKEVAAALHRHPDVYRQVCTYLPGLAGQLPQPD
jgi:hypothetical protein